MVAATKRVSSSPRKKRPHRTTRESSTYDDDGASSNTSASDEDEPLEIWPKYKDDLPNAFNGSVDPDLDYISKMPAEILEQIAGYCLMDHEPERALYQKANPGKPLRPHILLSLAAMSQPNYHAVEGFASRFLHINKEQIGHREKPLEKVGRRSERLAGKPQPEPERTVYRRELRRLLACRCVYCFKWTGVSVAILSNMNNICSPCATKHRNDNSLIKLTDARADYDLRDYHLLKSRQPGPRAKSVDHIPAIPYGVKCYRLAMPPFVEVTSYYFKRSDVKAIAALVHGDVKAHMEMKADQRMDRAKKARRKRVREVMIEWHESELAMYSGAGPQWRIEALQSYIDDEWDEESDSCRRDLRNCPGLCRRCLDVPNHPGSYCDYCCEDDNYDKRWNDFLNHRRRQRAKPSA